MKYDIIYADPPWSYQDSGCKGNAKSHYKTMTNKDICNIEVNQIASDNCALFMWAVSPLLPEALEVIKAWGFKYKTVAFCWLKTQKNGNPIYNMGRWTMGSVELCLLATKGKPQRAVKNIKQIVLNGRGQHSRKPDEVRKRIVELMGSGLNKIELFARERNELFNEYEGWHVWGNEIKSDIEL